MTLVHSTPCRLHTLPQPNDHTNLTTIQKVGQWRACSAYGRRMVLPLPTVRSHGTWMPNEVHTTYILYNHPGFNHLHYWYNRQQSENQRSRGPNNHMYNGYWTLETNHSTTNCSPWGVNDQWRTCRIPGFMQYDTGFLQCWALTAESSDISTVYSSQKNSMTIGISIYNWHKKAETTADSLSLPYMQGTDLSVQFIGRSKPSLPLLHRPLWVTILGRGGHQTQWYVWINLLVPCVCAAASDGSSWLLRALG